MTTVYCGSTAPHNDVFNVAFLDGHAKAQQEPHTPWGYFIDHSCDGWTE
jgi:prepilin-type processing-associated H-X9-DG protein